MGEETNSGKRVPENWEENVYGLGVDISSVNVMEIGAEVRMRSWDILPGPKPAPRMPWKKRPQFP